MTDLPLAHGGHWALSLLYIAPVVLIALGLWWSGRRERSQDGGASAEDEDHGEAT